MVCTGAKVLGADGLLYLGSGTVVGANAVLTQSTGENEIWAGIPAKMVRKKKQPQVIPYGDANRKTNVSKL